MKTTEIVNADPDEIIRVRPDALNLLGITRYQAWTDLVDSGEIAVFLPSKGRNGAYVRMADLQAYVNRMAARAEEQRQKRFRAAQRSRRSAA